MTCQFLEGADGKPLNRQRLKSSFAVRFIRVRVLQARYVYLWKVFLGVSLLTHGATFIPITLSTYATMLTKRANNYLKSIALLDQDDR
jgi:hypothetical protein